MITRKGEHPNLLLGYESPMTLIMLTRGNYACNDCILALLVAGPAPASCVYG